MIFFADLNTPPLAARTILLVESSNPPLLPPVTVYLPIVLGPFVHFPGEIGPVSSVASARLATQ
jgi:hypothetical protein